MSELRHNTEDHLRAPISASAEACDFEMFTNRMYYGGSLEAFSDDVHNMVCLRIAEAYSNVARLAFDCDGWQPIGDFSKSHHRIKMMLDNRLDTPQFLAPLILHVDFDSMPAMAATTPRGRRISKVPAKVAVPSPSYLKVEKAAATAKRLAARIDEVAVYAKSSGNVEWESPTPDTVASAKAFVNTLNWSDYKEPFITVSSEGEINFLWEFDNKLIDLGFFNSSHWSFYSRFGEAKSHSDGATLEELLAIYPLGVIALNDA